MSINYCLNEDAVQIISGKLDDMQKRIAVHQKTRFLLHL